MNKSFGVKQWAIMGAVLFGIGLVLIIIADIRSSLRNREKQQQFSYTPPPVPKSNNPDKINLRPGASLTILRPDDNPEGRYSLRIGYYGTNTVYMERDGDPRTEVALPARDDPNYVPLHVGGNAGVSWTKARIYVKREPTVTAEYYFVQ